LGTPYPGVVWIVALGGAGVAGDVHRYVGRGAALDVMRTRVGEVLLSGAAGTGKSRAAMEKLLVMALKYPRMKGLITRKTASSLGNTALRTWEEQVAVEALSHGKCYWYGGSTREAPGYKFANGSVINVGGMDKPSKIMSSEYDAAYVQEATELTEDDWEHITSRFRNGRMPYTQLIADCNPSFQHHWLKRRCDIGQTLMLESRHEDNPLFFTRDGRMTKAGKDYIEGKLDKLTGVRYLRLRKGLWVSAEGIVYEDWDPNIHVIGRKNPRLRGMDGWRRWWAIDFGIKNPFTLQCWAEDPDGKLFMYREIYMTGRLVEDHARKIMEIVAPGGVWIEPKPSAVICDHDAEGRETFSRHTGLGTTAAHKTVLDGIDAFSSRLKAKRLYVLRDSLVERDNTLYEAKKPTCFEEEIVGYIWEKKKEAPLKEDDHGCDTARYIVAHRDLRKRAGTRGWI
jgi:PBSX family phage terminase large subunit